MTRLWWTWYDIVPIWHMRGAEKFQRLALTFTIDISQAFQLFLRRFLGGVWWLRDNFLQYKYQIAINTKYLCISATYDLLTCVPYQQIYIYTHARMHTHTHIFRNVCCCSPGSPSCKGGPPKDFSHGDGAMVGCGKLEGTPEGSRGGQSQENSSRSERSVAGSSS